ncbi:response regulator [uncultured Sulfuricurvum sp.]|uniref:response regulator n=1 Tax=uncultured Sulfuricurvum sp. TaxID=430693 RepID=UPI00260E19FD|nr:response regulator [uncultured Sulfuricurvum sp.]
MQIEYKILWLDDQIDSFIDDEYVDEIRTYLENEGFEAIVHTTNTATDFFSQLDDSYDLILTDYHMGEMNGDKVVAKIRNESKIFAEILFYTARADLQDIIKLDRISFLETSSSGTTHENAVVEKIKKLIDLTLQKFHDIVVMRGMIMNETSDMDNQKLTMIQQFIKKYEIEKTRDLKVEILEQISQLFSDKLKYVDGDWKTKDNGFKELMKDNFVFSADYKIKTLAWILNELNEKDFSSEYQDEIIKIRNKFAHAKLEEDRDAEGKVIRKYFKHAEDGITFDAELCKNIRKNIQKHKANLNNLKLKINE